jgi:hypothetical protein
MFFGKSGQTRENDVIPQETFVMSNPNLFICDIFLKGLIVKTWLHTALRKT